MSTIAERAHRLLNLQDFSNSANTHETIAHLGDANILIPESEQYILRMPIREFGTEIGIPEQLQWIEPIYNLCDNLQKKEVGINHPFVYITVRHGHVQSETDDHWHVDGFSMRVPHVPEQNYIYSSDATELLHENYDIPNDFDPLKHNIHKFFDGCNNHRRNIGSTVRKCLTRIDPYVIHRRPLNTFGIQRTFFRISFVPIEIKDDANTKNPLNSSNKTYNNKDIRESLIDYWNDIKVEGN